MLIILGIFNLNGFTHVYNVKAIPMWTSSSIVLDFVEQGRKISQNRRLLCYRFQDNGLFNYQLTWMTNCNFGSLSYWRKNNLNGREVVFDQRGILYYIQMYCNERKGKFKLGTFDLLIFFKFNIALHFKISRVHKSILIHIHIDLHINRLSQFPPPPPFWKAYLVGR